MKKLILLLLCLFAIQSVVRADDDRPVKMDQLPQAAQLFMKAHFADSKVAIAKMESGWFDKNYDVIFTNGNKVEFDKQGNWKKVNCKYSSVPVDIIPTAIRKYVAENYPGTEVLKIERDKKDYEIKLSNKWELEFDLRFNLIDIDK